MKARIQAIASHLPERELTNDQLAEEFGNGWSASKILEKTGIASRRIASPDECASDIAVEACRKLFASGVCAPAEIDFLLFCTQSPDYFLPATACTLQHRLGLSTQCGAVDINQGCSGFIYGLALAKSLVEAEIASKVLLITAETYSKHINLRDRSVRAIFGDGAAAALVSAFESERELIGPFVLGTDGRGEKELIVQAGGMRRRPTSETKVEIEAEGNNWRSPENIYMNGAEIFNFTLQMVPITVRKLLEKSGKTLDQVDYFIFHQANRFMLERLRAKIGIPEHKFCLDLEFSGNTVSSTIPIALEHARSNGEIGFGQEIMLVGFGVGYSWGACMMRFVE